MHSEVTLANVPEIGNVCHHIILWVDPGPPSSACAGVIGHSFGATDGVVSFVFRDGEDAIVKNTFSCSLVVTARSACCPADLFRSSAGHAVAHIQVSSSRGIEEISVLIVRKKPRTACGL